MMECTDFRQRWSAWQAGELSPAENRARSGHARRCNACAGYHRQMQAMLRALGTLPPPGPVPADLKARLLERARSGHASRRTRKSPLPVRHWAVAASLLVAVIGSVLVYGHFRPVPGGDAPQVVLSLNQPQQVQLVFEAAQPVEEVEYRVELPEGVELEGYPDLDVLQWRGKLLAGRNGLALPLVAREEASGGVLIARIMYNGIQRELRVPVQTRRDPRAERRPASRKQQDAVSLGWNDARGTPS